MWHGGVYQFAVERRNSERRLAAMFGKTPRRWARHHMAEARQTIVTALADMA
jgi:hypothetical protein